MGTACNSLVHDIIKERVCVHVCACALCVCMCVRAGVLILLI